MFGFECCLTVSYSGDLVLDFDLEFYVLILMLASISSSWRSLDTKIPLLPGATTDDDD